MYRKIAEECIEKERTEREREKRIKKLVSPA
jgi:hypothetical protein